MDIETYLENSAPAGDQRDDDTHIAVTDLLNCLSRAAVDATAGYTEEARLNIKLGDVLWYVAAIARRRKLELRAVAKQRVADGEPSTFDDYLTRAPADTQGAETDKETAVQFLLYGLIHAAAETTTGFLKQPKSDEKLLEDLGNTFFHIGAIARRLKLSFSDIATANLERIQTLFGASHDAPAFFDDGLDPDEQLPRKFTLRFSESVRNELATVRMAIETKGGAWLPVGSPLNDNSYVDDDYRFHDVLHLAYVAVLGWSPVIRALFGLKRKSLPSKDRVDDGARATLLEEALTGLIYEAAADNDLFKNRKKLERRLLLSVKRLTRGLEVKDRTYNQWTEAILAGYTVFREITEYAKILARTGDAARHLGLVHVDMNAKTILFERC